MQPGLPSDERFTRANVVHAARSAVSVTVMIMALIIMAQVLAAWLTRSGLTRSALAFFDGLDWHRLTILIAISVFLIVLGMFMSQIEILVITLPFLFPLVTGVLDYHPIWFGIWMTKLLEIGLVTPPLGMNIFVTVSALGPGYKVTDAFRGVTPFYFADLVILAGLLVFPEVVTWVDRAI